MKCTLSNLIKLRRTLFVTLALSLVLPMLLLAEGPGAGTAQAQNGCQTFKETGKQVCGRFLQYWQQNGGLAQQGFPISNAFSEKSDVNGKQYTVQYFERAVFEMHPENRPPHDVLLSLLGSMRFEEEYGGDIDDTDLLVFSDTELLELIGNGDAAYFEETGKTVVEPFYTYWKEHGGLPQGGYPISEPILERSALDGKMYVVQYFERAVFEYHDELPEGKRVLLSQLGTFQGKQKYPRGFPGGSPNPTPAPVTPVPPRTPVPPTPKPVVTPQPTLPSSQTKPKTGLWSGPVTLNGKKWGDISFHISSDGKWVERVTYSGYWQCGGSSIETTTTGPTDSYPLSGNAFTVQQSKNYLRFEMDGQFLSTTRVGGKVLVESIAGGTRCTTYRLDWSAQPGGY